MTNQREIRKAFWEMLKADCPDHRFYTSKRQNEQPADVRIAFCDYVDHLFSAGQISESLSQRVTL